MVPGAIDWSNPSTGYATVAAVLSIVVGGVTTSLMIFIESRKEFRSRIRTKRAELVESVAVRHASLLIHSKRYDDSPRGELRGDGRNEPDLVGEYTGQLFKLLVVFYRLHLIRLLVKCGYWVLYMLIGLGIVGFLVNLIFDEARTVVFWYGVVAVVLELGVIGVVFAASQRLNYYEDVT